MTLRFNDSVDFSRYEDGIRQLLNTYVHAEDAKTLIEPLDITNKEKCRNSWPDLDLTKQKPKPSRPVRSRSWRARDMWTPFAI